MLVMPQFQEHIPGWPAYPYPRLDQKVLSRLAECDDVIDAPFLALPRAPQS